MTSTEGMRRGIGTCAYLDRVTGDGRLIEHMTVRPLPIPVTMFRFDPDGSKGGHAYSVVVGRVVFVDFPVGEDRVVAGVEITEDWAIDVLESEQHYMEIDLDDVDAHTKDLNSPMTIERGRLSAIHLGKSPCWPGLELRLLP